MKHKYVLNVSCGITEELNCAHHALRVDARHRVCDMYVAVLFATVTNFLLHSGFRQVKPRSRVLSSLGLTLPKFAFANGDDGFLIHSSVNATVSNISAASV